MLHNAELHIESLKAIAGRLDRGSKDVSLREKEEVRWVLDGIVNSRIWNDKELSEMLDISKSSLNKLAKGYPGISIATYKKVCTRLPGALNAIRDAVLAVSEGRAVTTLVTAHKRDRKFSGVEGWYEVREEDFDQTFIRVKSDLVKLITVLKADNEQFLITTENKAIMRSSLISLLETSLSMLRSGGHIEIGFIRSVSGSLKSIARKASEEAIGSAMKKSLSQVADGLSEIIKVYFG